MEIDAIDIKDIILQNRDNIAFIIGNGIHYQYHDCDISWHQLLENLWLKYIGEHKTVPNGISTTEFYDVLEMELYNNSTLSSYVNDIKHAVKMKDLKGLKSQVLAELLVENSQKSPKGRPVIEILAESIREIHDKIIHLSRKWCDENIDNAANLLDKECVYHMMDALSNNTKKQILMGSIKRTVVSNFPPKTQYNLTQCIKGVKNINAPILTTNFDTYISEAVGATPTLLAPENNLYKFTDFYPWNMYYGVEDINITNPSDGFAVWHINGTTKYPRSIRLGLSDYMGCVERARKMIQGNNFNEYFDGKNHEAWVGYNTWMQIIFTKDLFVFGLALEENEVFLRWLLIQRAKYSRMYHKTLKGWYIGKDINKGKRFFLEHVGFKVIDIPDYNVLYQALETL